ncbi:hypothetical protein ACIG0D_33965 [Streptomyces sp. NPDC052773]|uniref:hypothetical protein n=1 Tax=Streptomyces sp. NPDC052773 TaxID=3365693 RepID=UPI0037D8A2CA
MDATAGSLPGALTMSYEGQMLRNPHVVKLRLRNAGRHAVASDHYDQGRPIRFDLGRPVILLDSSAPGAFSVEGSRVSYLGCRAGDWHVRHVSPSHRA